MKIAYFGGDMFISSMEMLIQSGHEIISLFTIDDLFTQKIRNEATKHGIPVKLSKPTADDIEELQQMGCEMILSAGYSYKIPEYVGKSILYGVNIHPSLLPEGAGPFALPLVIGYNYK